MASHLCNAKIPLPRAYRHYASSICRYVTSNAAEIPVAIQPDRH